MKPEPLSDTESRHWDNADILRVTLVVLLIASGMGLLLLFLLDAWPGTASGVTKWRMGVLGGAIPFLLVALALLRRGRLHLAAAIFMIYLFAGTTFVAIWLELGVHAIGLGFFTFLIILSGFLLRPGAAMVAALLSVVTVLGLFWAEKARLIAGPTLETRPEAIHLAATYVGIFLAIGWLTTRYAQMIRDNLASIKRAQQEAERLNQELRERTVQAEAANVAKSQFLATMSHEIRTPMNAILGMAQLLLLQGLSEEEQRDYVRIILSSGNSLLTLLNDILDLSKVEAGKLELSKVAFSPEQVLDEVSTIFSKQAAEKGLTLSARWMGKAEVNYRGDPFRLRQMIANLVNNAVKFTDAGSVRVEAEEIERRGQATLLSFTVTDSGPGLSTEEQARLFQPFTQIDSSNTRRHGGTGLGLSIVRSLALLMNGDVGIHSAPGRGATFWLRVWVEAVAVGEETPVEESPAVAPRLEETSPRRILIAEDVPLNRRVIEAMLTKIGYSHHSVDNGMEAVEAATRDGAFDLVLMDCEMPVMDGFEATERIRAWERQTGQPRLPIVALTAGAYAKNRQRCFTAGMDDFLTKPANMTQLRTTIEQALAGAGKKERRSL